MHAVLVSNTLQYISTGLLADQAVEFWRRQAESLGVELRVLEPAGKPICIITVEGTDPTLPSIMLNSHMDVVPAVAVSFSVSALPAYDAVY